MESWKEAWSIYADDLFEGRIAMRATYEPLSCKFCGSKNIVRYEHSYGNYSSDAAVYYWVVKFTKVAVAAAKNYKPDVGDTWVADETMLTIGGEKQWFRE